MDISMDLSTSLALLTTVATVLGFYWQISVRNKRRADDEEKCEDATKIAMHELEEDDKKLKEHMNELDKKIDEYSVELEKLHELTIMFKEENMRLRQEFLDNLDRIEQRLEKMIDLILRIKRDE
jgi:predicted  nucleic acid-binding Zn-ribbon protein